MFYRLDTSFLFMTESANVQFTIVAENFTAFLDVAEEEAYVEALLASPATSVFTTPEPSDAEVIEEAQTKVEIQK